MAGINLTIPNDKIGLVVDTLCHRGNYTDTIDIIDQEGDVTGTEPNPLTRSQFAKVQLIRELKRMCKLYNRDQKRLLLDTDLDTENQDIENIDIT